MHRGQALELLLDEFIVVLPRAPIDYLATLFAAAEALAGIQLGLEMAEEALDGTALATVSTRHRLNTPLPLIPPRRALTTKVRAMTPNKDGHGSKTLFLAGEILVSPPG